MKKALVVYYSRKGENHMPGGVQVLPKGNTEYAAEYIAKAIGADITMAWPNAQIGTMDAKLAAKIICDGQGADAIDACAKEYAELQNNVVSAAKRGYVDTIIDAADTRKYVIGAFEMLYTKREDRPSKKHGTV